MSKIFISYRHSDSDPIVGRIYDYLIQPLGPFLPEQVFRDKDSIPLGVDFKTYLVEKVAECVISLVIIGPTWATITDQHGNRRLDDPDDFVRIEVESALQRHIPVIPLLVMGARMPSKNDLPDSLRPLVYQNGTPIRNDPDFKTDLGRLLRSLEKLLSPSTQTVLQVTSPVTHPKPQVNSQRRLEVVQPPTPSKAPQAGEVRIDDYGVAMVYVPAGEFLMGSDPNADEYAQKDELPQHQIVFKKGFWIDQYEVTNEVYDAFIRDNGYQNQRFWTFAGWTWARQNRRSGPINYDGLTSPNQPRVGVTWYEAYGYCAWRSGRLPTEAEWEYAARGPQNLIYPWGNDWYSGHAVWTWTMKGNYFITTEVGSKPQGKSWVNAFDMSGNVEEWCSTVYMSYPYNAHDGREEVESGDLRVTRGGGTVADLLIAFFHNGDYSMGNSDLLRSVRRGFNIPNEHYRQVGFRCVRSNLHSQLGKV